MENMIKIHLERLPEGFYLATSDDIQGLVAQGRTIAETIEIAGCGEKAHRRARLTGCKLGSYL